MRFTALVLAFFIAGCCSGAPAVIDNSAAPQAVAPINTLGFRPGVRALVKLPVGTLKCIKDTGSNIADDLLNGASCVIDSLTPIRTPASSSVQSSGCVTEETTVTTTRRVVPQVAPKAAPQCAPAQAAPITPKSGCVPPPMPVSRASELPSSIDGGCNGQVCSISGK